MVRPALVYGTECWTVHKTHENKVLTKKKKRFIKLTATENKLSRMTSGVTLRDKIHQRKPENRKIHNRNIEKQATLMVWALNKKKRTTPGKRSDR